MYAIFQGLSDMEELERVEAEEAARSIQIGPFDSEKLQVYSFSNIVGSSDLSNEWLFLSDFALSLGLFVDFGIFGSVGTLPDIRSGF